MTTAVRALLWELLWKNRVIFAALGLLLALGAGVTLALAHAGPDAGWTRQARATVGVAFFASMLLSLALFTLMENHEGWRMNSMVTRWFVLPVPTSLLVLVPLVIGVPFISLVVVAWTPVLARATGAIDMTGVLAAVVLGVVALQTLAWILPRKPGLFWMSASLLVPAIFLLAVVPQDTQAWPVQRIRLFKFVGSLVPILIAVAYVAARSNRHGGWTLSRPVPRPLNPDLDAAGLSVAAGTGSATLNTTSRAWSPALALFRVELLPRVRGFVLGWLAFAALITGCILVPFIRKHPDLALTPRLFAFAALDLLPALGVGWLALWGMLAGCERGTGFRTQLTSFRATLPVNVGTLAGERILALGAGWLLVWLPLLAALPLYSPDLVSDPTPEAIRTAAVRVAWHMAISAHVLVGGLPWLLRGRLAGAPNILLATLGGWAFTWYLCGWLRPGDPPIHPWTILAVLFLVKFGAAAWGLVTSLRSGHILWRFALLLPACWIVLTATLIWVLPVWQTADSWRVASIALLMPLARLAWCPAALAANRHR